MLAVRRCQWLECLTEVWRRLAVWWSGHGREGRTVVDLHQEVSAGEDRD